MLTSEEKAIVIAHGVSLRIEFKDRFEDGTNVFMASVTGSAIFGHGEHLEDWKEAARLAWNQFWTMAEWAIDTRLEDAPRDPLAIAVRRHREGRRPQ